MLPFRLIHMAVREFPEITTFEVEIMCSSDVPSKVAVRLTLGSAKGA